MATRVNVYIKDSGKLDIIRDLRMNITGGVHEDTGAEVHGQGPLNVAQVAAVNEFGGGRIPARMWLRGWKGVQAITQAIRGTMVDMIWSQKFESTPFGQIAEDLMNSLRTPIVTGAIQPANAPLTLAKKKPETRPLFEHGQLVQAIQGRVEANNGWNERRS
jgi:hypothetical protein